MSVLLNVPDPLVTVGEVRINDGSAQRSRVTSLTVTFSSVVTLRSGAFELLALGGKPVELEALQALLATLKG